MTMTGWQWLLVGFGATLAVYAALLVGLALAGRRGDARALASFIPDCLVLLHVLLRDPACRGAASCCSRRSWAT